MTTKRNKSSKNNTKRNHKPPQKYIKPSLKYLKIGYSLYASKKYEGDKILEYNRVSEKKTGDHCLLDNSSWFGDLDVAKSYAKKDTHIYEWKIKKPTYLLNINKENESFVSNIFTNTKVELSPTVSLTEEQIKKLDYDHPYLNMTPNEKAMYEFNFAFGYLTLQEQYEFLKLVKYHIKNKLRKLDTREEDSILKKIDYKINYYRISALITKKTKYNRLSFYLFDKHAIMNLCRIVRNKKNYKISGVYQKNDTSFWFPDLVVYKMNIQEYILFNPQHNLNYYKALDYFFRLLLLPSS